MSRVSLTFTRSPARYNGSDDWQSFFAFQSGDLGDFDRWIGRLRPRCANPYAHRHQAGYTDPLPDGYSQPDAPFFTSNRPDQHASSFAYCDPDHL